MVDKIDNPYRSPASQDDTPKKRRPSWTGTAVIVLAILLYGPMTFTPLVRALMGVEVPQMLLVSCWNGAVFLGLLALGRWLRRRSLSE